MKLLEGAWTDEDETAKQLLRFLQHRGRADNKQPQMVAEGLPTIFILFSQIIVAFLKVLTDDFTTGNANMFDVRVETPSSSLTLFPPNFSLNAFLGKLLARKWRREWRGGMVHPTQLLRLLDLDQILFLSNLPSFLVLSSSSEKVVIYGSEKKEKSR